MRKKLLILLMFALFLSITTIDFSYTKADSSPVTITVNGSYASYFQQEDLIFNADYSLFNNYSALTFTANSANDNYSYVWQTKDGRVISQSSTLNLVKVITSDTISSTTNEDLSLNLILVGTMSYRLIATNINGGSPISKNLTVIITQNAEKYDISTYTSKSTQEVITKVTNGFNVYAFLPTTKTHTINWYLKTPNGVSYDLVSSNVNKFHFEPNELITDENGYGTYKMYAVATEKATNGKTFTSNLFEFVAMPSAPTVDLNSYKIVRKEIKNTKTKIQAFKYSVVEIREEVASSTVLDSEKILWYVNGVLISNGRTFNYEPTSTDVYNVTVKHLNIDGTIIQLASFREQPKSTGIGILLLIIAGGIVVLSGIFTISVVRINKKRDVIW